MHNNYDLINFPNFLQDCINIKTTRLKIKVIYCTILIFWGDISKHNKEQKMPYLKLKFIKNFLT